MKIDRIEPPCWWTGMKTPLQLLVKGDGISSFDNVRVIEDGIVVTGVSKGDSPDYLFIFVEETNPGKTLPGKYNFVLSDGKDSLSFRYDLLQRRKGSMDRESFTNADAIYLLMPDRFSNGDPSNDSVDGCLEKADRHDPNGRHGGDLTGMINHLDYIASLGATAIWSTPLLEDNEPEGTYHGYACSDYYKIDPRYGSNDLYRTFVAYAHDKHLKVIMDVVTNHCGTAHWWMKDMPFSDWIHVFDKFTRSNYVLTSSYDPHASEKDAEICTDGWFDTSMPDMAVENPYVLQYFTQVFIWWIEWADIDGLRVDTFPYNDKYAIAQWCANIRREYPHISIMGECWLNDTGGIAYWEGGHHNKDGYNSNLPVIMDFPLMIAVRNSINKSTPGWGEGASNIYNTLAMDYMLERPQDILIMLSNHDTERFADIVNGDVRKMKIGFALLGTMRGIPQMYYGEELGLQSAALDKGDGGKRIDFPGGWSGDSLNLFDPLQRNPEEASVYDFVSKLFNYRKGSRVLQSGKMMHFNPVDNVYSYIRYGSVNNSASGDIHSAGGNHASEVFVAVNLSRKNRILDWSRYDEIIKPGRAGKNIINGNKVVSGENTVIKPLGVLIAEFSED
ncbi:MAG: glycoside hydrolase family 13 protein [Bacteroidales bacterium]|nr:glycoside hydrolase family 13 protein [Bacteroidales bacterium]